LSSYKLGLKATVEARDTNAIGGIAYPASVATILCFAACNAHRAVEFGSSCRALSM